MQIKKVINFIFELGQLKRVKHEGWRLAGVSELNSVGEHSLRAAQIGYVLACLENYSNPEKICSMLVFHDIDECRIGDIHRVANRYITVDKEEAVKDQTKDLENFGKEIFKLYAAVEYTTNTIEGNIAKDADYLEQAFSAKEYMERGYPFAEDWINNISRALRTESAKRILEELRESNSNDWWQGIKKFPKGHDKLPQDR